METTVYRDIEADSSNSRVLPFYVAMPHTERACGKKLYFCFVIRHNVIARRSVSRTLYVFRCWSGSNESSIGTGERRGTGFAGRLHECTAEERDGSSRRPRRALSGDRQQSAQTRLPQRRDNPAAERGGQRDAGSAGCLAAQLARDAGAIQGRKRSLANETDKARGPRLRLPVMHMTVVMSSVRWRRHSALNSSKPGSA